MSIKRRIILLILAILIIIFGVSFIFLKPRKILYLEYGDDFSKINLYQNNKVSKLNKQETQLIFYLSDTCNPCIQMLSFISQLDKLEIFKNLSINLVWVDKIPNSKLDKYNFNNINNFSLKGKVQLTGVTPYFYILENNKVVYNLGNDNMSKIIKKILQLVNNGDIEYEVLSNLCSINGYRLEETLLVFLTEDCEGCKKWEEYLQSKKFEDEILLILDYQTDKYNNYIYDRYGFYKEIFGIDIYPSALICHDNILNRIELEELY